MKITAEQIISWEPCDNYPEDLIHELVGDGVTVEQILETDKIPTADKIWLLTRKEFFPDNNLHELACRFAEYALSKVYNPDPWSIEAVRVRRQWMQGKATDEQLEGAYDAARGVAWAADRKDSSESKRAAYHSAAWAAEWPVVSESTWFAACSAVGCAEWSDILKIIKDYIGEQNEKKRSS
jgi:hypothetical protein